MQKRQKLIPNLILIFGIIFSFSITLYASKLINEHNKNDNQKNIDEIENKIKLAFSQYLHPLEGNASLYRLNNFKLNPHDFRDIAESRKYFKEFNGALGFGYIKFVKEGEINSYVSEQRKFNPDFNLRRLINDNQAPLMKDYFIIETVEPKEINSKAIGLVISDEHNRLEAAQKAMRDGVPILTKSIQLVQDNTKVPGFLLVYPIYRSLTVPRTEIERIKNLVGFTYAPVLSSAVFDFVKKLDSKIPPFEITEVGENRTIYKYGIEKQIDLDNSTKISILGNDWILKYSNNYSGDASNQKYLLILIFLFSISVFTFFAYYIFKKQVEMERLIVEEIKMKNEINIATQVINDQRLFFKKMLDTIPSFVGYWDKDLLNVFSNSAYVNFYGKTQDEIYGKHISKLLPQNVFELNKPFLEKALAGETQIFRRTVSNLKGEKIEFFAKCIPDVIDGKFNGIFVVVEDVTAFVEKEVENKMLLEVMEHAPMSIEITDKNNIIKYVNQYHVQITGYSKDETINYTPGKFASGKTPSDVYKSLKLKLDKLETWNGEFINRKKNGEEYVEFATISAILDGRGEVKNYIAIKKDITEQKKLENQLMFNSKLATLGEMAAGVAHEINNPLSILLLNLDSLEKKQERMQLTPEILKSTIEKSKVNVQRISRIVKSLKLYSRNADKDSMKLIKASEIVDSVLDLCSEKVKFQEIHFEKPLFEDFEIECNDIKIQQILVNLINNAAEAVEGKEVRWLKLVVEHDLNDVYFKVYDSGVISNDILDKIFDPFFTTKAVGKGTGLGLSISLNIAREHHGLIYVDKNHSNTCFVLKFPLKVNQEKAIEDKFAS